MFVLLNAAFAALRLWFGTDLAALDSPRFAERQAALKRLWNTWPLSAEACRHHADTTDSLEARMRAEHVVEDRPAAVWARMMAAPAECWDETLAVMLADEYERDGLPWERGWTPFLFAGHEAATDAMKRLVERGIAEGWMKEDDQRLTDPVYAWEGQWPDPGVLVGFSEVRFRRNGLPTPYEWLTINGWNHSFWGPMRTAYRIKKNFRTNP